MTVIINLKRGYIMSEENLPKNMPSIPAGALSAMLADPSAMNVLYNQAKKLMWTMVEYKDMQMLYSCALKEIETKFEILSTEFNTKHKRNPISSISTRLKSRDSIAKKLAKSGLFPTVETIENNINDMAGIRVICSYIDDIYAIADALLRQDDIKLIARKDYIENPKPNGYRSLHLIITVPVFLSETKKEVKVEVQIRTIAMDFWASLEHQLKYKKDVEGEEELVAELKRCADVISDTDRRMLTIREKIESAEDAPTEDEQLFERLRKIDMPI